jgi:hypothetical protein
MKNETAKGTRPRTADQPTGAGAEATRGTDGEPKSNSHEHRSGYGGKGGSPKAPNDPPKNKR